jgi:hypothetical protein
MSALPPKADISPPQRDVRLVPIADILENSPQTSAGKPYREPHRIARKLHAWRFSGIREYCFDPLRWLGNAAMRLSDNCAQHCSPMQRILGKFFLGSFGCTRACCSRALAHRRTVFEVLYRKPTRHTENRVAGNSHRGWTAHTRTHIRTTAGRSLFKLERQLFARFVSKLPMRRRRNSPLEY